MTQYEYSRMDFALSTAKKKWIRLGFCWGQALLKSIQNDSVQVQYLEILIRPDPDL